MHACGWRHAARSCERSISWVLPLKHAPHLLRLLVQLFLEGVHLPLLHLLLAQHAVHAARL